MTTHRVWYEDGDIGIEDHGFKPLSERHPVRARIESVDGRLTAHLLSEVRIKMRKPGPANAAVFRVGGARLGTFLIHDDMQKGDTLRIGPKETA